MNSMVDLSSSLCKRLPEGTWDTTCDDFLVRKVSFRIIGFWGSKMLTQRQARTGVIPLRPPNANMFFGGSIYGL